MLKTFTTSLFILCLATSGILMWQWHAYSKEREIGQKDTVQAVRQHVQLQVEEDSIQVTQAINHIEKGTYTVLNPKKVIYTINGKGDAGPEFKLEKGNGTVTFNYRIPLDGRKYSHLLTDWALRLENVETESTTVEITVFSGRGSSWSAGAKMIGKTKKELIDYYVFKKDGPPFPLYFEKGNLVYTRLSSGTFVFYEDIHKPDASALNALFEKYGTDNVYILTPNHPDRIADGLRIINTARGLESLETKLVGMYADSQFPFLKKKEEWQQNILLNIQDNRNIGGPKTKAMTAILKEQIPEEELALFLKAASARQEPLTASILDGLLSDAGGKSTLFFSANADGNQELVPLSFFQRKSIFVNDKKIAERALIQNYSRLLPFVPIVRSTGFTCTVIDSGEVLATRGEDVLRLYPDKKVFILNGTDYSVSTPPLTDIGGVIYINETWLMDIFGASISENNEMISISL